MASALVGAAGSYFAAKESASAARAAAAAQERIARENIAFQKDMYNQNVERMDPWVQYGSEQRNALAELMPSLTSRYDMAKYQAGPEYQNIMAQTDRERKALEAKSSASGMYGSGTMANQLQSNAAYLGQQGYQQGLQNYEGQNRSIYDMLNTGSNVGLLAAGQQGTYGTQLGNQVGQSMSNIGNAQAQSAIGQGQAWGGMSQNLGNIGMNYLAQRDQYNQLSKALSGVPGYQPQQRQPDQLEQGWNSLLSTVGDWFRPSQPTNQGFANDLSSMYMPTNQYTQNSYFGPTF